MATSPILGNAPAPIGESGTTTRAQAIALFAEQLTGIYGADVGVAFRNFAAQPKYANTNTIEIGDAFLDTLLTEGFANTVKQFATAAGTGVGQEAAGAGAGVAQASKDLNPLVNIQAFLGLISSRAFIVRVVKVIAGLVLVVVGLAELTGASGKIPKVVPV
jgi:hypothetical protein